MHIHILGICGTFMGSLAQLAKALGHRVTGSDVNVYPPMSTQLEAAGISIIEGWNPAQLDPPPDLVVVGNALSRGNPAVEYLLEHGIRYTSGPQWLGEHLLADRWVLAVAGTHGKTTTSSMLAWILHYAGLAPGYLIGGVPKNFGVSARLGDSAFFVVEADEYDSAFFDKRSKFVHYRPRTAVLNNLEFDHADIFPDLAAIQTQFHHLVRTIPGCGLIVHPGADANLQAVFDRGCWTPCETIGDAGDWRAELLVPDGSQFRVWHAGAAVGDVVWSHTGLHNVDNGLAAIVAARHVGVPPAVATAALGEFEGVKRRMECLAEVDGIRVYDDFAHHPTAIATTLEGLRQSVGNERIVAVIEPRSNTMRMGIHRDRLSASTEAADAVLWYQPQGLDWNLSDLVATDQRSGIIASLDVLVEAALAAVADGGHIVIMSNGGFGGFHEKLVARLAAR